MIIIEHVNDTNIRKSDTNDTILWHMVIASFWPSVSCEQFKSLVFESGGLCASSNTVLEEENNLLPITDWLFS